MRFEVPPEVLNLNIPLWPVAQTRVSAVVTNAPVMLNVDCDMFANNPQVALHAMCLLLGFDDELHSGFVQAPQKFYGGLKDDPFGNQSQVMFEVRTDHYHSIGVL
jgi:hypothetical protein